MNNGNRQFMRVFLRYRYTKTVVDASQDMQKYNPEVKPNPNPQNGDKRIADLADKLRHIHNVSEKPFMNNNNIFP